MKIDEVQKKLLTANEVPRTCSKQVAIAWRDNVDELMAAVVSFRTGNLTVWTTAGRQHLQHLRPSARQLCVNFAV